MVGVHTNTANEEISLEITQKKVRIEYYVAQLLHSWACTRRGSHPTTEILWFFLLLPYSLYEGNGTTQLSCQQVSE